MADLATVAPYWELTFDADGDVDRHQRDRLLTEAAQHRLRDLVVFSHGWNNDRSIATRLYHRFFALFPPLAPTARIGYAGILWPSMRFSDEPIPDFPRSMTDTDTEHALLETFPGRATLVEQIARMLEQRPPGEEVLEEYSRLVRLLVDAPPDPQAPFAADTLLDGVPQDEPEMLNGSTATACEEFARALAQLDTPAGTEDFTVPNPWNGAQELLRQATYYAMKRRAGTVGERGLGPVLGRLAREAPHLRVHLLGHSFGARLVSFALAGLPQGVRTVKSVTLLQGAFSHYAFAARLPHDRRAAGVLHGRQNRVDGPLVCCHSRHDSALGTFYPLASRMAGDARGVAAGFGIGDILREKWGALGYGGVRAVSGTPALTLTDALRGPLPASGCVNVDAAQVVRRGGPPSGAHSDIVHPELARVVLAAGRIG